MTEVTKAASSAIASLNNLKSGLQNVQSTIVSAGGDPYLRLLQDGEWVYGQENIEVQEGSLWAVNPFSLMHGWVSWTDHPGKQANEVVGEVMVPMTKPLPPVTEMRDTGWEWRQQLQFQLRCMNGEDVGQQVLYKTTSVGGMGAVKALIPRIMNNLDEDPDRPVPVIELETDSYNHKKWGKTYTPVFTVVKFVELSESEDNEAAAPKPEDVPEPEKKGKARQRRTAAADDKTVSVSKADREAAMKAELERASGGDDDGETDEAEAPQEEAAATPATPTRRRRRRT